MKAQDVINQLKGALPLFTSKFTTTLSVSSAVVSSNLATITTTNPHNLTTNNVVVVRDAITPNAITSLARVGSIATAVTLNKHNITKKIEGKQFVTISGTTEPEYNGSQTLLKIIDGNTFTFLVDSAAPTPATGSPILEEFFLLSDDVAGFTHINGAHKITATSPTTFTYPTNAVPDVTAIGTILVESCARISSSVDLERVIDSYTSQKIKELWGFVILEDRTGNKDRRTNIDAASSQSGGSDSRMIVTSPFSFYVFVPTRDELSGRLARDEMEDLTSPLFKSLLGVRFETGLSGNNWSEVTFISHGIQAYNTAFYVHRFSFESIIDISFEDTAKASEVGTVFRCIDMETGAPSNETTSPIESTINLDD